VVVKAPLGDEARGEEAGAVFGRPEDDRARAVGEDGRRLLLRPVEVLRHGVRADDEDVAVRRIGDDVLRGGIERGDEARAGAVHVERPGVLRAEAVLDDDRGRGRDVFGRVGGEDDEV
jgi:hypothetical protein